MYNLWRKHPSAPQQLLSCMGHCTTGMCVCTYRERDVPISILCEAHGLSQTVEGKGGNRGRRGEAEAVI